ncbi:MAG: diacylglycerol kinase family lipid kinase [Firmicutes bacterium]|nr:diacylglycerol kinase family lipid kinase [Bacillota bacterium]MCL2771455.1 diacylglycerol kinase family lipid kinase [Bacillota bacterium]
MNPVAGKGKARKTTHKLVDFLTDNKIMFRLFYSHYKGHMGEIARELEKKGEDNVIIVGGDGSINEVLNGLENPKKIKIGIIPCGTGNDFSRAVGISTKPSVAMKQIMQNNICEVDYLKTSDKRAINTISIGIDIAVIKKYNRYKSAGKFNYYKALIRALLTYRYTKMQFDIDGIEKDENEYFVAAACNGKYFGGNMMVSPYSKVDDGKISFVAMKRMSPYLIPFRLLGFIKGKHIDKPYVERYLAENVVSNTLTEGNTQTVNYDGELVENSVFDVSIVKNGLNIYLPK